MLGLEILGIQILGILFALLMLYLTFLHYKRDEFSQNEYLFWQILWALFAVMALFPKLLSPFTHTLNLNRTMDLLILLGFIFVIGLLYHNYISLQKTKRRVEEIVGKIAIKQNKK